MAKRFRSPGTPHKSSWCKDSDETLLACVRAWQSAQAPDARISWVVIAENIPGRTAKQCRERWNSVVNPALNRAPWTRSELLRLDGLITKYGTQWMMVAQELGTNRSELMIRNLYYAQLRKHQRTGQTGPVRMAPHVPSADGPQFSLTVEEAAMLCHARPGGGSTASGASVHDDMGMPDGDDDSDVDDDARHHTSDASSDAPRTARPAAAVATSMHASGMVEASDGEAKTEDGGVVPAGMAAAAAAVASWKSSATAKGMKPAQVQAAASCAAAAAASAAAAAAVRAAAAKVSAAHSATFNANKYAPGSADGVQQHGAAKHGSSAPSGTGRAHASASKAASGVSSAAANASRRTSTGASAYVDPAQGAACSSTPLSMPMVTWPVAPSNPSAVSYTSMPGGGMLVAPSAGSAEYNAGGMPAAVHPAAAAAYYGMPVAGAGGMQPPYGVANMMMPPYMTLMGSAYTLGTGMQAPMPSAGVGGTAYGAMAAGSSSSYGTQTLAPQHVWMTPGGGGGMYAPDGGAAMTYLHAGMLPPTAERMAAAPYWPMMTTTGVVAMPSLSDHQQQQHQQQQQQQQLNMFMAQQHQQQQQQQHHLQMMHSAAQPMYLTASDGSISARSGGAGTLPSISLQLGHMQQARGMSTTGLGASPYVGMDAGNSSIFSTTMSLPTTAMVSVGGAAYPRAIPALPSVSVPPSVVSARSAHDQLHPSLGTTGDDAHAAPHPAGAACVQQQLPAWPTPAALMTSAMQAQGMSNQSTALNSMAGYDPMGVSGNMSFDASPLATELMLPHTSRSIGSSSPAAPTTVRISAPVLNTQLPGAASVLGVDTVAGARGALLADPSVRLHATPCQPVTPSVGDAANLAPPGISPGSAAAAAASHDSTGISTHTLAVGFPAPDASPTATAAMVLASGLKRKMEATAATSPHEPVTGSVADAYHAPAIATAEGVRAALPIAKRMRLDDHEVTA